jgi:PAS domain S-box-containing protein
VDDDPNDRALTSAVLLRHQPEARVDEVGDAAGFALALARGAFDLVVTEFAVAWSTGPALLAAIREIRPDRPIVVFTRAAAPATATEALRARVHGFLIKSSEGYLRLPEVAEEATERSEEVRQTARDEIRLHALLDRANVGVFRSTLDERVVEASAAFLRLLGVESLEEALEIDLPPLYFSTRERGELLRRLDQTGRLHVREVELKRADGSTIWVNLTEELLLDADGDMVIDGLVEDISDLKRREDALHQEMEALRQSNMDLRQFAYVASHELQEPLRMVDRYGRLLAEEYGGKLTGDAAESLGYVRDGTRRMQALVDDLLTLSRVSTEGQDFEPCDANALVDRAVRSLADSIEETRAQIKRGDLPVVRGDASQLVQLFQNLLANAIKFRGERPPRVEISAERQPGGWRFAVRDHGIGIDSRQAETVFEMFRRLNPEYPGTGMGLAICRRIVERHGGRIWVEPQSGAGATLCFTLPEAGGAREAPPEPSPRKSQRRRGTR